MKINVFYAVKVILPIFFVSFVFSSTAHAKVLYGVSLGGNMDLPGGDYAQFYIHNVEECLKMCANEDKCAAYSFDQNSQNCRLKDFIPKSVPVRGMISGHKLSSKNNNKRSYVEPIPVPGNPAIEILPNTDLPGGDFHHTRVGNVKKCAQICKENTRCKAFTFNTAKEMCWLKDSISKKRYSPGHISGQKSSVDRHIVDPPVSSTPNMEILQKTDLPGSDFNHTRVNNATECAQICREDFRCKAFTFNIVKEICWLKDRIPEKRKSSGHISGQKSIPDMEIMKQTDVPGGDYLQTYQKNARKCANVCTKDAICDAFTYVKAAKLCKLKSFQPKPIWKKGNISGIKR